MPSTGLNIHVSHLCCFTERSGHPYYEGPPFWSPLDPLEATGSEVSGRPLFHTGTCIQATPTLTPFFLGADLESPSDLNHRQEHKHSQKRVAGIDLSATEMRIQ